MKTLVVSAALAGLLGCVSSVSSAPPTCGALDPCVAEGNVAVIGNDAAARTLLAVAQTGATQFERYFGVPASPVGIVPGGEVSRELTKQLEAEGYASALPWISATDQRKLREASVKKQVLEQTKGMPEAQQQAILAQAMSRLRDTGDGDASTIPAQEQGALTHELGHLWFKAVFQSDTKTTTDASHGYGGWAPDWLDETAAILMENDVLRQGRRDAFADIAKEALYPLEGYLTMDHPALASALKLAASFGSPTRSGNRTIVLTGEEAEDFLKSSEAGDPAVFYIQTQGFIDFVTARTGNEQIFAEIATHLGASGTFESWLETQDDLPQTTQDLVADWNGWLDQR